MGFFVVCGFWGSVMVGGGVASWRAFLVSVWWDFFLGLIGGMGCVVVVVVLGFGFLWGCGGGWVFVCWWGGLFVEWLVFFCLFLIWCLFCVGWLFVVWVLCLVFGVGFIFDWLSLDWVCWLFRCWFDRLFFLGGVIVVFWVFVLCLEFGVGVWLVCVAFVCGLCFGGFLWVCLWFWLCGGFFCWFGWVLCLWWFSGWVYLFWVGDFVGLFCGVCLWVICVAWLLFVMFFLWWFVFWRWLVIAGGGIVLVWWLFFCGLLFVILGGGFVVRLGFFFFYGSVLVWSVACGCGCFFWCGFGGCGVLGWALLLAGLGFCFGVVIFGLWGALFFCGWLGFRLLGGFFDLFYVSGLSRVGGGLVSVGLVGGMGDVCCYFFCFWFVLVGRWVLRCFFLLEFGLVVFLRGGGGLVVGAVGVAVWLVFAVGVLWVWCGALMFGFCLVLSWGVSVGVFGLFGCFDGLVG